MAQSCAAQQPNPVALPDVVEVEGMFAALVHEHKIAAQLRSRPLLLERLSDRRKHNHVAFAERDLRKTNTETIDVPADLDETLAKVDVVLAESQRLAGPEAGED